MEGLWPSEKLLKSLLYRWADSVVADYELDEAKRAEAREAAAERWGRFLRENRATIQPLANEFVEIRMAVDPPSKATVQAWARRALPVLEQVQNQLTQGLDDFREVLDEVQRAKFEREALEMGIGLQIARQKLRQWENGDVDLEEFWERPQAVRRERAKKRRMRRREMHAKLAEAQRPTREQDQIALEVDAWDQYVKEFIELYGLDEGQRNAARSLLGELKRRALAHRDARRTEIAELEARIRNNSGTEEELAEIKKRLIELYGPVDEMFKELKRRMELIPTADQRAGKEPEREK